MKNKIKGKTSQSETVPSNVVKNDKLETLFYIRKVSRTEYELIEAVKSGNELVKEVVLKKDIPSIILPNLMLMIHNQGVIQ